MITFVNVGPAVSSCDIDGCIVHSTFYIDICIMDLPLGDFLIPPPLFFLSIVLPSFLLSFC